MKLKFLNTISLFCIFVSAIALQGCGKHKKQIVLFDNEVALRSAILKLAHDQPFLNLIQVKKLNYNLGQGLSVAEMFDVASSLLSKAKSTEKPEDIVLLFIFTTDEKGSARKIAIENTHAFSTFSFNHNVLEHRYYEKQDPQYFVEVPSLRIKLNGGFSNDDIRMLHFAAVGKNGLPSRSTIYEFSIQSDVNVSDRQEIDYSIRRALLLDKERYWGASTSGLYGEELQAALMPQEPGGEGGNFCGFINPGPPLNEGPTDPKTGCPKGADPCYSDPIAGTKKYCTNKDKGGCFAAMATALRANERFRNVHVDFKKLWAFQDKFLLKYEMGRDYVASYILISLFTELDSESLKLSVDILPYLYRTIDILMSKGSDDTVVVTPEFSKIVFALIERIRDDKNQNLKSVWDRIEKDLKEFQGLSKKKLVTIFRTRSSVSLNSPVPSK